VLFIPLSDDNPLRFVRYQWVTIGIIVVNVLSYLLQFSGLLLFAGGGLSVVPAELLQLPTLYGSARQGMDGLAVPEAFTLLTYMFLHTDVLHLLSNMIFLWVFGDNVEDAMGHLRYLAFYLLCGMTAALTQSLVQSTSQLPIVGASGAIAGTISAYLILHPRVLVWVLAFRVIPLRITASWILGVWVLTQAFMILISRSDQVAWWAHIGGLAAGALLVPLMRRKNVPLFDRGSAPIDRVRDTWWREYRAGIFHRGLTRLRRPLHLLTSLARYSRAIFNRYLRTVSSWVQQSPPPTEWKARNAEARAEAPTAPPAFDVLGLETRGENFALVRTQADGSRSEIVLTAANVVHLGLLAPGFAREVLTDKVSQQPGVMVGFLRHRAMSANLRLIELIITLFDKGGERFDFPVVERRARALASKLLERADRIANVPGPTREMR
jgi:membrane associated rhomboid family serine protease